MYKMELKIDGMACSMCEAHINDVINKYFKVKKVKSSHKDGITTIICDDVLDQSLLHQYIDKTGYKLLDIKVLPYQKKFFGW